MTDTKHISDAIKGLPDDGYIGVQQLNTRDYDDFCKTDDLKALVAENEAIRTAAAVLEHLEQQGKRFMLKGGVEIARRFDKWALYDISGSIVDHYDSLADALKAALATGKEME